MSELKKKKYLDSLVKKFNNPSFIEKDPISIPSKFTTLQDIEIIGFWVAMLSWGQRVTIINKGNELLELMDNQPYDFILNHKPQDLKRFELFKHRTFNGTDALYFLDFFQRYYNENNSLESAFLEDTIQEEGLKNGMIKFHQIFFDHINAPKRTTKHVATPVRGSTCKRINMFLRWMVRPSDTGVDFGLWKKIKPSELYIPLDVHVERVARQLGLINRKQRDWKTVIELTNSLKVFDKQDPVKYDFALFGLGVLKKDENLSWPENLI